MALFHLCKEKNNFLNKRKKKLKKADKTQSVQRTESSADQVDMGLDFYQIFCFFRRGEKSTAMTAWLRLNIRFVPSGVRGVLPFSLAVMSK